MWIALYKPPLGEKFQHTWIKADKSKRCECRARAWAKVYSTGTRHREIGVDASIGWGRLRWMVTSKKPVDVKKE